VQLIPGPDIGTTEEEYYTALEKAGLQQFIRKGLLSNISKKYSLPLDNIVTAYGAIVASDVLLKTLDLNSETGNIRYVIEGFGKVGTGIAAILHGNANLVGISTQYGSIGDTDGFEILQLIELHQTYGDYLVDKFQEKMEVLDLFEIPCDIMIPGARTGIITENIAQKIVNRSRPKVVVPVSNAPYTEKGLQILQKNGIICFPDFIASAGAVIAAMIEFADAGGENEAMNLVKKAITKETEELVHETMQSTGSLKLIYNFAISKSKRRKLEILETFKTSEGSLNIDKLANEVIQRYTS
ncbi:MAG: hypothetical protein ACC656_04920, partial [Candidatus Heimdallarchaeota archaeon]